ncbi:MAG: hypothetical protein HY204_09830 [Nitrospirae bacterium]|nr:hypothetical protein [Nitrospirota bacterium]
MLSKTPKSIFILCMLFVFFSANAYACLFSMTPAGSMAMNSSMPMHMPMNDDAPLPCQTTPCDAMTSQNQTEDGCLLSATASTLTALKITPKQISIPVLAIHFLTTAAPIEVPWDGRPEDSPRPLYSVSILLLHSTLLL